MGRILAFVSSLVLAASVAAAPPPGPPQFRVLRSSDGLPSNMAQVIRQDHAGFIWIGTRHGLARYDGVGFRHWLNDPRDPGSLGGNDISTLLVDHDGQLWVGIEGGGVSLLQTDGRFSHFRHVEGDPGSLASDDVLALAEDSDGAVWVGTYLGGLARIDRDRRVTRFEHSADEPQGLRSNFILGLHVDRLGRLWIGTDTGLDVRTPDGRFVHVELPPLGTQATPIRMVTAFWPDADGDMLVGLRGGVIRVGADLVARGLVGPPVASSVTAIVREPAGVLWVATVQGLLRAEGGDWHRFAAGEHGQGDVPGTRAYDAYRDREGSLWFAFPDGGVARLSAQVQRFALWRPRSSGEDSLTHSRLAGVAADPGGGAWVVSDTDGLDHVAADGTVTRHGARIPNEAALRAIAATDGQVWIGRLRGVLRYVPATGHHDELAVGHQPDRLPEAPVVLLRVAPDGALWAVARGGGVSRIDPRTRVIRTWAPAFGTLGHADITALRFDGSGTPWIVGSRGFERYDAEADRFVAVSGPISPPVQAFAFAADGSLWLHRLGVLERHRRGAAGLEHVESIGVDDGWPVMEVRDIHVDAESVLWLGGFQGLWRVDPRTRSLRMFAERDGLPSAEFVGGPLAAAADGSVFAATLGGLVAFDPLAVQRRMPVAPPIITSLSLRRDGATLVLDPQAEAVLRHDDRDLHVEARALSFATPGPHRFAFRLHPDEPEWTDAGSSGERTFSRLSAGVHTLSVRVSNVDGSTSELATPLAVRVAPAPWQHPLAWFGYAVLAVCAGSLAWRAQQRRAEQRHQLALAGERQRNAERLDAARSAFLATMSHEIRTPMTGVLGMTELLQRTSLDARQRAYADAIATSGELLLRLVNDSLDLARIDAGKLSLESQPFDPAALLREVAALEEPQAARKQLGLQVAIAADLPARVDGDALRVKQVLLNLVNNALKFTERGEVSLRASPAPTGGIVYAIADSGPGMTSEMRERLFGRFEQSDGITRRFGGSGLGLSITRELVELMGGRIVVESTLGEGSEFRVELPLETVSETAPAPVAAAAGASGAGRLLHVLVVEDDSVIAEVLAGMLDALGHRATRVADGLAALAELSRPGIDLALVDLDLPGIGGFQLARLLRQREASKGERLPLIAISARAFGDEDAQARAAGMDGFLRKPLTAAMLEEALAPWLAAARTGAGDHGRAGH